MTGWLPTHTRLVEPQEGLIGVFEQEVLILWYKTLGKCERFHYVLELNGENN